MNFSIETERQLNFIEINVEQLRGIYNDEKLKKNDYDFWLLGVRNTEYKIRRSYTIIVVNMFITSGQIMISSILILFYKRGEVYG